MECDGVCFLGDGVDRSSNILMFNAECKMKEHPFYSICDKSWIVNTFDSLGKWCNDPSIALICKN